MREFIGQLLQHDNLVLILFITFELLIVVLIAVTIRLERYRRLFFSRQRKKYIDVWIAAFTDLAMGFGIDPQILVAVRSGRKRREFRDILIKTAQSLNPSQRPPLVELYKSMGFLSEDHKLIQSLFLSNKLKAMSRIEVIQDSSSIPYVVKLFNNKDYYLRFIAIKYACHKNIDLIPDFDKKFSELLQSRTHNDLIVEVLATVADAHIDYFKTYFSQVTEPRLKKIFLKVIHSFKISECLALVRESLKKVLDENSQDQLLLKFHMLCLTMMPDDESEQLLNHLRSHKDVQIRFLAICSLLILRPELKHELYQSIDREEHIGLNEAFEHFSTNLELATYG
jgi:AraC-like DNA-binding protein